MTDYKQLCAELTDDLEEWIDGYLINDPADEHTAASFERINRARAALAEPEPEGPTPQPIWVSERLPGPEDCTSQGWCWVLYRKFSTWTLEPPLGQDGQPTGWSHWLPAHALPLPS